MNIKIWQTFYRRMRMMVYGKMVKARFPDDRNLLAYLSEFHRDKGPKTAYIYASTDFVATSVLQMLGDSDCGHYFIESDFVNLVVAQAPDGSHIATATQSGDIHVWRLADKNEMRMSGYPGKRPDFHEPRHTGAPEFVPCFYLLPALALPRRHAHI